jgi:hypothetical protein
MADPKGIQSELVGAMEYAESGHVVDLYVNYEGLELLRDNTSRELSQYFDGLVKEADGRIAEFEADKHMEQDPLPGL